jgi:hypothetical protein
MLIEETMVNATKGWRFGASGLYEPFTDDLSVLYRALRSEHGRCIGKVYIDTAEGTKAIGWVFQKRARYDDCNETYLQETWVTLHDAEPTVERTFHHHYL